MQDVDLWLQHHLEQEAPGELIPRKHLISPEKKLLKLPDQVDATSLADLKAELFKKKNEAQKNRQQGNYRPEKVGNKFAFFIQKNSGS